MKKNLLTLLAIIQLALIIFLLTRSTENRIVAQVGKFHIPEHFIELKQKLESCYGSNISKTVALIQIINDAIEKEVLEDKWSITFNREELKEKARWVDNNTKAPEILSCIKNYMGAYADEYFLIKIMPTLVNPRLHKEYNFSMELHAHLRKRINEIKDSLDRKLKRIEDFPEYRKWEVPKKIAIPDELIRANPRLAEQDLPFIKDVIRKLKHGEIYNQVYEDEYTLMLPRLLTEDSTSWHMDGIVIQKRSFDDWIKEYVAKRITLKVFDKAILEELKARYNNVWWVKYLK